MYFLKNWWRRLHHFSRTFFGCCFLLHFFDCCFPRDTRLYCESLSIEHSKYKNKNYGIVFVSRLPMNFEAVCTYLRAYGFSFGFEVDCHRLNLFFIIIFWRRTQGSYYDYDYAITKIRLCTKAFVHAV